MEIMFSIRREITKIGTKKQKIEMHRVLKINTIQATLAVWRAFFIVALI
jgi:hypothetical protein